MRKTRKLIESASTIEVAIAKSLSGGRLLPSEIEEVKHLTTSDFMIQHELDSLMAEEVVNHIKSEFNREMSQSMQTWSPDSRDLVGGVKRSHPVKVTQTNESKKSISNKNLHEMALEDITDLTNVDEPHTSHSDDGGRMLDYGHVKSDSSEGRMMRQALYEMSEYSKDLHDMLTDDDDLPQWCHYKIAVARACVGKVRHYLEYKIKNPKQK